MTPLEKNFQSVSKSSLPSGRKGKHHSMLVQVLEDLQHLERGRAIKIPIADFTGSPADIRSAITRATKKQNIPISTSTDGEFFYVWKADHTPAT